MTGVKQCNKNDMYKSKVTFEDRRFLVPVRGSLKVLLESSGWTLELIKLYLTMRDGFPLFAGNHCYVGTIDVIDEENDVWYGSMFLSSRERFTDDGLHQYCTW